MLNFKVFAISGFTIYTCVCSAVGCTLERNEFNDYPWLLKIVVDGSMRGPGSLVTPYKVISAAKPFWPIVSSHDPPDLSPIEFVGFRFKSRDVVECSIMRKAVGLRTHNDNQDLLFWMFQQSFDTLHQPFLWPCISDIDINRFNKVFRAMRESEACDLPVFETNSPNDAKIKLKSALFSANAFTTERFVQLYCHHNSTCMDITRSEVFFAWDENTHMPGQVIICHGLALGSRRLTLNLPRKSSSRSATGPTMYENFGFNARIYQGWALKDWPKEEYSTTSSTIIASDITERSADGHGQDHLQTGGQTGRHWLSTEPDPDDPSSEIPLAQTMKLERSMTIPTKMFVRTLPKLARAILNTASVARDSSSVIIITLCFISTVKWLIGLDDDTANN